MPTYKWKAKTRQGVQKSGEIVAETKEEVMNTLKGQAMIVTSVRAKSREIKLPTLGKGVKDKDLAVFTRQFSVMVDAGLPIVQCLDILGNQQENPIFKRTVLNVRSEVESGSTLSEALRTNTKIFDRLYCNLVEAGEAGGILDTILRRLADYIEKSLSLKRKIKSAMIYPSTIIFVAVVVVFFIMVAVIPTFSKIFDEMGVDLPLPTRITLVLSDALRSFWYLFVFGFVGISVGIRYYYKTSKGKHLIDRLLLKLPVFGVIIQKAAIAKFSRTLGTLISSGIPILEGLEITAKTAGNVIVEDAVMRARSSISEGKTIAEPLQDSKVFPPMVIQMINVGEKTGAIDAMLDKIADFYEEEVDTAVGNMTQLIEPMLMMFLGAVIGFIIVAMYMPMFKLISTLSK
jgi:type IV pilus assembly protein PilC